MVRLSNAKTFQTVKNVQFLMVSIKFSTDLQNIWYMSVRFSDPLYTSLETQMLWNVLYFKHVKTNLLVP